ncbi:uncharacterized protein LOC120619734 isoform X2 [Pteropus medius]|uniref:uncharacterized protein LOC120619734 isoform X2 n=1 Tax=Pteropus vampyrus TaxID=132908 RepID=UPI00196B1ABA|nr:uncharacterized protein LOC120619734 isoform X2 [Pteropus giganteus]
MSPGEPGVRLAQLPPSERDAGRRGGRGFLQLVQEGQVREACLSISSSARDGQDCGSQYQVVAQSMWQVVQQALGDVGPSKELKLKLQLVVDAIEWTRDALQNTEEGGALWDGGVAAWGCQLERLLRTDAEARVPTWAPGNQLDLYLKELDKAVGQGLGPRGAGQLGPHLGCVYKMCFQEVLLSRLSEVLSSCHHWESYDMLYTWGQTALFGQQGSFRSSSETLLGAPVPSQEPEADCLLNQLVFVTWMSQVQKTLVELIQEVLTECLEKVLICEWRNLATSPYHTLLDLFQLLEETINSVQHVGPPVAGWVQAMVLERFLKFLPRCQAKAARFLQNVGAETFPELHVLGNCYISGAPRVSLAVLWASDLGGRSMWTGDSLPSMKKGEGHWPLPEENMAGAEPGVHRIGQLGSSCARHHRCHRGPQLVPPSVQSESIVPESAEGSLRKEGQEPGPSFVVPEAEPGGLWPPELRSHV